MEELYRNLIIAMICVFLTTFVLISNLFACSLVLFCVVLTLVSCRLLEDSNTVLLLLLKLAFVHLFQLILSFELHRK